MYTAAIAEHDGHPVVLTGGSPGGPIVIWDPLRGELAGQPYHSPAGACSMLISATPQGLTACWGDFHGNIFIRSAADADPWLIAAHDNGVESLAECQLNGDSVLVSGGRDGAVRVWQSGTGCRDRPANRYDRVTLVPAANHSPPLVACVRGDGVCPVFDAGNGDIIVELASPTGARHLDIATLPGRPPLLVTRDSQSQIAVWQPPNTEPVRTSTIEGNPESMAVANGERPVLLATLADGRLAFVDLASGEPARPPLACHTSSFLVTADPEQPDDGTLRLITWSIHERSARLWSVRQDTATCRELPTEFDPDYDERQAAFDMAFGWLGNRRVAAAVGSASHIHVWDANDGSLLIHTKLLRAHRMAINSIGVGELAGRSVVFCGGYICSLGLWPLDSQEESHVWVGSPLWSVKPLPGDRVVVAGTRGIMALQLSARLPGRQADEATNT
jgi:WD40 repeat protein